MVEKVPESAGISDEQLAVVFPEDSKHQGKSKVLYRIRWACTYLKKIGAAGTISQRGVWSITQTGLDFLQMDNPEAGVATSPKSWGRARRGKSQPSSRSKLWKVMKNSLRATMMVGEDWKDTLLRRSEEHGAGVLSNAFRCGSSRRQDSANVEVLGKSGDGGIDGVGVYKVSLVSFPTYFQCKRYAGSVPPSAVRGFRGAMAGRGEKGILITTGTFTRDAKAEAVRDGAPPVDLIDGDELCDLLLEYEIGIRVQEEDSQGHHRRPRFLRVRVGPALPLSSSSAASVNLEVTRVANID